MAFTTARVPSVTSRPVVDRFIDGPSALITASVPLTARSTASLSRQLPGDDREMGVGEGEFGGGSDQGRDLVAVVEELLDNEAPDGATRTEDGDAHERGSLR